MRSLINFDQLVSFRVDQLAVSGSQISLPTLTRLVASSSAQFRLLSTAIPDRLSYLHMFFDSIDDLAVYLQFNHQHLRSLGVGLRCDWTEMIRLVDLFESFTWPELIEFNLNLGLNSKSIKH